MEEEILNKVSYEINLDENNRTQNINEEKSKEKYKN